MAVRLSDLRFTPTHVGNTLSTASRIRARGGSPPRTWGIRLPAGSSCSSFNGSPPRTWGIRHLPRVERIAVRFTPTHVGNTSRPSSHWCSAAVHPHARGEYVTIARRGGWRTVHPHARGEYVDDVHLAPPTTRFTPTHVGNTLRRARGRRYEYGSPPRTWGIPATTSCCQTTSTVHPHARGEYCFHVARLLVDVGGSPPRTWGILPFGATVSRRPEGSPPRTWGIPWKIMRNSAGGVQQPCGSSSLCAGSSPSRAPRNH